MTDGGLLKKAMEQKTESVVEAEIQFESDIPNSKEVNFSLSSKSMQLGLLLAILGLISGFVTSLPRLQQEYPIAILLPILFYQVLSSFYGPLLIERDRCYSSILHIDVSNAVRNYEFEFLQSNNS